MGEHFPIRIEIGGKVARSVFEEKVWPAFKDGAYLDEKDNWEDFIDSEHGFLTCEDEGEGRWNRFEGATKLCRELGLTYYVRVWSDGVEGPTEHFWDPSLPDDDDKEQYRALTMDSEPYITAGVARSVLEDYHVSMEEQLRHLETVLPPKLYVDPTPALEVTDG